MTGDDDTTVTFDFDDLTVDEVEAIEDALDMPLERAFAPGQRKGKALRVMAWIVKRRTDPDFTLEQAGKMKVTETVGASDPLRNGG
jgi:hypothetical protein